MLNPPPAPGFHYIRAFAIFDSMPRRFTLLIIVILSGSRAAAGPMTPAPSGRSSHAMTYHSGIERVVMYGGNARGADGTTLWMLDAGRWHVFDGPGPDERSHFAFAYDATHDQLLVHGGFRAEGRVITERLADTWSWDDTGWHLLDRDGFGSRDHHAMVYDAARGEVILFGGGDSTGTMHPETWAWDGIAWTPRVATGPPPRTTHRMIYDTSRQLVLVFGGYGEDGMLGDTWAWNGTGWKKLSDAGPSPRFATRWAFDSARGEAVLFGGRGSEGDLGDTWIWNGETWREAATGTTAPSPRNVHAMAYDAANDRVVLFGGYHKPVVFDDLWAWNGERWLAHYTTYTQD